MTGPLNEHGHMASQSGLASGQLNVSSSPKGRGFLVRFSDNKEPKTVPSFREVVSRNPSETGNMDSRLQMSGMTVRATLQERQES
jgi:hypothetical protein